MNEPEVSELRLIRGLLTALLLSSYDSRSLGQSERIGSLSKAGLPPKEIAELLGTTSNTVSVALYQLKKKGTTSKKAAPK